MSKKKWIRQFHPMYIQKLKYPNDTAKLIPTYIWRREPYYIVPPSYITGDRFILSSTYGKLKGVEVKTESLELAQILANAYEEEFKIRENYFEEITNAKERRIALSKYKREQKKKSDKIIAFIERIKRKIKRKLKVREHRLEVLRHRRKIELRKMVIRREAKIRKRNKPEAIAVRKRRKRRLLLKRRKKYILERKRARMLKREEKERLRREIVEKRYRDAGVYD